MKKICNEKRNLKINATVIEKSKECYLKSK